MSNNNLDKQIADKFAGYKATGVAADWEKMEALLDDKPKRRIAPFWIVFGLAFLLVGLAGTFYKVGHDKGEKMVANSNTHQSKTIPNTFEDKKDKEAGKAQSLTQNKEEELVEDAETISKTTKEVNELESAVMNEKAKEKSLRVNSKAEVSKTKAKEKVVNKVRNNTRKTNVASVKSGSRKVALLVAKENIAKPKEEPQSLIIEVEKPAKKSLKNGNSGSRVVEQLTLLKSINANDITTVSLSPKVLLAKEDYIIDNRKIDKPKNWKIGLNSTFAFAQFMHIDEREMGYGFGLNFDRRIKNNFWLTTGVNYTREKYHVTNINLCATCVNDFEIINRLLEVPIQLRYEFNSQNKWSPFVAVGVSHYFNVGGFTTIDFTSVDTAGTAYDLQLNNSFGSYPVKTNNINEDLEITYANPVDPVISANVVNSLNVLEDNGVNGINSLGWGYNLSVGVNHQLSNKWELGFIANYQRSFKKYNLSYDGLSLSNKYSGSAALGLNTNASSGYSPLRDFARYNSNSISFGSSIKFKF